MGRTISSAEANRKFSTVMRGVRAGHSYVVTSHGLPVARILPFRASDDVAAAARDALLARLAAAPVVDVGGWTRNELYEQAPDEAE